MRRHRARASFLLMALAVGGCAISHIHQGTPINKDRIKDIKIGVTTKQEIIDWFGPPQEVKRPELISDLFQRLDLTEGETRSLIYPDIFSYQYNEGDVRAIILVLFNHINVDLRSDTLAVFFDEHDRVKYVGFSQGVRTP
jgi:hypothetical protein